MRYFSVKNFEQFQHYKDRAPEWIKLYSSILRDYGFSVLPDATKYHLVGIWVLASQIDNKIPDDAKWIGNRIGATTAVNLGALVDAGFLVEYDPERARGKRENWPSRYVAEPVRKAVMERDGGKCRRCGTTERLEIDHIQPISQGGTGAENNLQVLCVSCNRKKRAEQLRSDGSADATQLRSAPRADGAQSRSLETETESETEKNPPKPPKGGASAERSEFEDWYAGYPHKVQRGAAERAWRNARRVASLDELKAGLARYVASKPPDVAWRNPATWLNGKGWLDAPAGATETIVLGHSEQQRQAERRAKWAGRVAEYRATGKWQSAWGSEPWTGNSGCLVPPEFRADFIKAHEEHSMTPPDFLRRTA